MTDQNRKSISLIFLPLILGITVGAAAYATLKSESNKWADEIGVAAGISTSASAHVLMSAGRKRREGVNATATKSCCDEVPEISVLPIHAQSTADNSLQYESDSEAAIVEAAVEEETPKEEIVSREFNIAPCIATPDAIVENLVTEESEQIAEPEHKSEAALSQFCEAREVDSAHKTGFSNEAGYSARLNDTEISDFDITIGLPVLTRSQYRRESGVPQRLKSVEGIVWSNTKMLEDGRRIMEGTFAADSNTESIWSLVLNTLGVQQS